MWAFLLASASATKFLLHRTSRSSMGTQMAGVRRIFNPAPPATLATSATDQRLCRATVARVATVAAPAHVEIQGSKFTSDQSLAPDCAAHDSLQILKGGTDYWEPRRFRPGTPCYSRYFCYRSAFVPGYGSKSSNSSSTVWYRNPMLRGYSRPVSNAGRIAMRRWHPLYSSRALCRSARVASPSIGIHPLLRRHVFVHRYCVTKERN